MIARGDIEQALYAAGAKHVFVEDCSCGCQEFYAFGRRGGTGDILLAFAHDPTPITLRPARTKIVPLGPISVELRALLANVEYVLDVSDPPGAIRPERAEPPPVLTDPALDRRAPRKRTRKRAVKKDETGTPVPKKKRVFSPEAIENIRAGAKRRWAAWHTARLAKMRETGL